MSGRAGSRGTCGNRNRSRRCGRPGRRCCAGPRRSAGRARTAADSRWCGCAACGRGTGVLRPRCRSWRAVRARTARSLPPALRQRSDRRRSSRCRGRRACGTGGGAAARRPAAARAAPVHRGCPGPAGSGSCSARLAWGMGRSRLASYNGTRGAAGTVLATGRAYRGCRAIVRNASPPRAWLMDLQAAFEHALPSPGWALAARRGTLAVFVAADAWAGREDEALALLDDRERGRVERKRLAGDRALTALAYACHRLLLSRVLGGEPSAWPLDRAARGRPGRAGGGLLTSLSHADGLVATAVSAAGPVGIDIEPASRARDMDELAARVCHPRELAALSALPGPGRGRALLSLWVRKEALLKAAGIGMEVEMDRFQAPPDRVLALPGSARDGSAAIRMFDGGERFLAAAAAPPGAIASAWLSPPAR